MMTGLEWNRSFFGRAVGAVLAVTFLVMAPAAAATQVSVVWDLPTENEDGTPLEDLAGVRLHYGTASGSYSGALELPGTATQGTVTGLVEGVTYYFAAKAYNAEDVESAYSEELVWTTLDETDPVIEGPTEHALNEDAEGGALLPDFVALLTIMDNLTAPQNIVVVQTPAEGTRVPAGTTAVTVTATDAAGNSSSHVITVSVNATPVVDAGADDSIRLPVDTAALNGTVSDDALPTGGTLTTTWTMVSGPGTVVFTDASAVDTEATFSMQGEYVLRLTVSDGELTAMDEVTVRVKKALPKPPKNLRIGS
ncbi:MAG: fibronectin type III domain-containing protein [Kiritimatiellae bacterium]|nr:fibronectin type III domain-containing protein [Kiritimatiellia bacterium]